MHCSFHEELLEKVKQFHGHSCPGLTIGIRAAEAGLEALGRTVHDDPSDLVAVVETDMCGVDAIQYLTGCTLGKGNLIHKDHGKMAFSFYDRSTSKGVRVVLNHDVAADLSERMSHLMGLTQQGTASQEETDELARLRQQMHERYMNTPLDKLFKMTTLENKPPRKAKILSSLICEECGEKTMESRTRRMHGKTICIPCFHEVEQKV